MVDRWGNNGNSDRLFSWAPKSLQMVTTPMKLKDTCSFFFFFLTLAPWKKNYDKPRQYTKKQRHHFTNKGPYCQSYGILGLPWWLSKESTYNAGGLGSIPGLGRSPGGGHGKWLQYSSLENPHGQSSLTGYSPWSCKRSDTTEQPSTSTCMDVRVGP